MPVFTYKAKNGPQSAVQGSVESENRLTALEKLADMGYYPLELEERGEAAPGAPLFQRRVPLKDLGLFTRQLADLIDSGVPLIKALKVAGGQTQNLRLARIIGELTGQVEEGKSLSESLSLFPRVFPPLHASLVRAGETAGVLGIALTRLSDFAEQEDDLRSRLRAAMAYPLLIAVVGAGTVLFLMSFVVPKIADMFMDMGQTLPLATRALMALSRALIHYGVFLAAACAAAAVIFRSGRGAPGRRQSVSRWLLNIPVWGGVARKAAIARFARTLGTLLSGGVPILDALRVVSDVMGPAALREQVLETARRVQDGAGLAEALRRMPDFPPFLCNMIAVGEEGNRLEKSLEKVAATYERETDRALKMASSLLEPLMILVVGGFIGVIVIALLLPIFQIPTLVK